MKSDSFSKLPKQVITGLYVITDGRFEPDRGHIAITAAAIAGGAPVVQLRETNLADRDLLEVARRIRTLTLDAGITFIINNRLDIAIACNADGLHIGQDDFPASAARKILGPSAIIGVSTSNVEEALKAETDGADYVGVGPVFSTMTKLDAGEAVGLETVTRIKQAVRLPVVAIGGISISNIRSVALAGADSAAVISAVTGAPDMAGAVKALSEEFRPGS
ncbi:MAG: thiamine phosphate synthase [Armatimonadota bacterium]